MEETHLAHVSMCLAHGRNVQEDDGRMVEESRIFSYTNQKHFYKNGGSSLATCHFGVCTPHSRYVDMGDG